MCLIDDHVHEHAARALLVLPGGREVHVGRHELAGADRYLADEVLSAAALMGRHHVLVAVGLADGRLELVEVPRARVSLVAEHQRRPLPVAHRVRARVGEQVDIDILRAEQERVVAGLGRRPRAFIRRGHPQRLDHLDLPGLGPGPAAELVSGGHGKVRHRFLQADSQFRAMVAGSPCLPGFVHSRGPAVPDAG